MQWRYIGAVKRDVGVIAVEVKDAVALCWQSFISHFHSGGDIGGVYILPS